MSELSRAIERHMPGQSEEPAAARERLSDIADRDRLRLIVERAEAFRDVDAQRARLLAAVQARAAKIATLWAEIEADVAAAAPLEAQARAAARDLEAFGHEAPKFSGAVPSLDGAARALPASLRASVESIGRGTV